MILMYTVCKEGIHFRKKEKKSALLSAFCVCCIYSSVFKARFFMEANKMNPDQGSSLIWVHIVCTIGNISRQEK